MRKITKTAIFVGMVLVILQIGALPLTLPEAVKLQKDVLSAPYSIFDYEESEFDCSNMAALLVDDLDKKGWNASIRTGCYKYKLSGHAWVEANGKCIEATKKMLLPNFINDLIFPERQETFGNSSEAYQSDCLKWSADFAQTEWGYQEYLMNRNGYG